MALQFSVDVRNARLDAIEATIGTSATIELRTGAPPANCADADSGTLLATVTLPADWMANATAGAKALSGSWTGTGVAAGTAAHFRLKASAVCHLQGTVGQTVAAGGSGVGDLLLDNPAIVATQAVTVSSFALTDGNP